MLFTGFLVYSQSEAATDPSPPESALTQLQVIGQALGVFFGSMSGLVFLGTTITGWLLHRLYISPVLKQILSWVFFLGLGWLGMQFDIGIFNGVDTFAGLGLAFSAAILANRSYDVGLFNKILAFLKAALPPGKV